MEHRMKLQPAPLAAIRSGRKTVELRLYDEKRRKLAVGDVIVFSSAADETDTLRAQVRSLAVYEDFPALFGQIPPEECGFDGMDAASAAAEMLRYYPAEQQAANRVLGIRIRKL